MQMYKKKQSRPNLWSVSHATLPKIQKYWRHLEILIQQYFLNCFVLKRTLNSMKEPVHIELRVFMHWYCQDTFIKDTRSAVNFRITFEMGDENCRRISRRFFCIAVILKILHSSGKSRWLLFERVLLSYQVVLYIYAYSS